MSGLHDKDLNAKCQTSIKAIWGLSQLASGSWSPHLGEDTEVLN